jgi:hypothetical protein
MLEKFFTFQLACALRAAGKFNLRDAISCTNIFLKNCGISRGFIKFTIKIFIVALTPAFLMASAQRLYRLIPKNV